MTTRTRFRQTALLLAMTFVSGLLPSCHQETVIADDPTKGFSADIQHIISETIINDLRSRGMIINEGKVPPTIKGAFRVSPFQLLSPFGVDDPYAVDKVINDYVYTFYGQTTTNGISYDYTNSGSDQGTGKGAFVAGNGNRFTIFSEDAGISRSIPYKTVAVMSGELTSVGIRDFQYAFVMKEKTGDPGNTTLIPVNAGRIWFDGDKLAALSSGGRLGAATQKPASALSVIP